MARPYFSSPLPLKLVALDRPYLLRYMRDEGPADRLVAAGEAVELPPNTPVQWPRDLFAASALDPHYFCENCHLELRIIPAPAAVPPPAESNTPPVRDSDVKPTADGSLGSAARTFLKLPTTLNCPRCHGSTEFA